MQQKTDSMKSQEINEDLPEPKPQQPKPVSQQLLTSFDPSRKVLADLQGMDLQELISLDSKACDLLTKILSRHEEIFASGNMAVSRLIKLGMRIEVLTKQNEDLQEAVIKLTGEVEFLRS